MFSQLKRRGGMGYAWLLNPRIEKNIKAQFFTREKFITQVGRNWRKANQRCGKNQPNVEHDTDCDS